jgi:hypothetical protein
MRARSTKRCRRGGRHVRRSRRGGWAQVIGDNFSQGGRHVRRSRRGGEMFVPPADDMMAGPTDMMAGSRVWGAAAGLDHVVGRSLR